MNESTCVVAIVIAALIWFDEQHNDHVYCVSEMVMMSLGATRHTRYVQYMVLRSIFMFWCCAVIRIGIWTLAQVRVSPIIHHLLWLVLVSKNLSQNDGSNHNRTKCQCNAVHSLDIIHRDAIDNITMLWEQSSVHMGHCEFDYGSDSDFGKIICWSWMMPNPSWNDGSNKSQHDQMPMQCCSFPWYYP